MLGQTTTTTEAEPKRKAPRAADRALNVDQIRKLIALQTPDNIIAQEILSRGLIDNYTRKDIDRLKKQGAGIETLTALEYLRPVANLTVVTEPGATLRLDGGAPVTVGSNGKVTLDRIEPGQHQILLQKHLFMNVARDVELRPRENVTLPLALRVDESALNTAADKIHSSFKARLYQIVADEAALYLQAGARDKHVLLETAISYLEINRFAEFRTVASEALTAGGTLSLRLQHYHGGLRTGMHPAVLQLSTKGISFQPEGNCNFEQFDVPRNEVRLGSRLAIPISLNDSIWVVNLIVPNRSNSKKQQQINLTHDDQRRVEAIRELLLLFTQP